MSIKRTLQTCLMLAVAMCLIQTQDASAIGGKLLDQTGHACCPVCDHVCKLDAKQIEEEKTCFEVESKAICIPRVVFPWQRAKKAACASCDACDGLGCTACVHNGARVRKICVLKTEKYKCPACKYTWSAEKKDSCGCCPGGCAGGAACDGGCCDAAACDSGCAVLPPSAPVTPAPAVLPAPVAEPNSAAILDPADYYRQPGQVLPTPISTAAITH